MSGAYDKFGNVKETDGERATVGGGASSDMGGGCSVTRAMSPQEMHDVERWNEQQLRFALDLFFSAPTTGNATNIAVQLDRYRDAWMQGRRRVL